MTNSASEPGGEDVLASIRRLILATPAAGASSQASTSQASPSRATPESALPAGDRLLLTPALRVAEPAPTTPSAPRGLTLEDRIAELEAAVGSQVQEFEPDGSEVAHVRPPEDLVRAVEDLRIETVEAEAAEPTGEKNEIPPDLGEAVGSPVATPEVRRGLFLAVPPQPEPPAAAPSQTDDEPMPAGLFFTRHDRAAEGQDASDLLPSGGETDDTSIAAVDDMPETAITAEAVGEDHHEAAPFSEVDTPDAEADLPRFRPTFRHAAHLTEPTAGPSTETADLTAAWDPALEPEVAPEEDWHGSEPSDAADVALTIDEERLRALVAELLHQELQGPLGEKITRNIRKLVRREIERALAVRDFE